MVIAQSPLLARLRRDHRRLRDATRPLLGFNPCQAALATVCSTLVLDWRVEASFHFQEEADLIIPILQVFQPEAAAHLLGEHAWLRATITALANTYQRGASRALFVSGQGQPSPYKMIPTGQRNDGRSVLLNAFGWRLRALLDYEERDIFPLLQSRLRGTELARLDSCSQTFRLRWRIPALSDAARGSWRD